MYAARQIQNISIFGPRGPASASDSLAPSILVVDDETFVAHGAAALLRAEGFHADVAHCGQQALEKLSDVNSLPQLVILDIAMPDIDGIEVLRRIRAEPSFASISIIMYSAFCDPHYQKESERLGANGYVVKSGNWPELLRQVKRVLKTAANGSSPPMHTD